MMTGTMPNQSKHSLKDSKALNTLRDKHHSSFQHPEEAGQIGDLERGALVPGASYNRAKRI